MNNLWVWLLQHILDRYYWYDNYYLRSNHWLELRERKREAVEFCEKCRRPSRSWVTDVHHIQYYRAGKSLLWHEQLSDLQVLCRRCHMKIHNVKG